MLYKMVKGYVYKIIHNQSNIVYVGSTMNEIRHRWQNHKSSYNYWKQNKKVNSVCIYTYFEQYGIDNFKIILIKEYEVVDRKHLELYESLWILKLKSVNKLIPFCIKYLYHSEYRKLNEDRLKEYSKQYYEDNKEQIKELMMYEYYNGNRKENNMKSSTKIREENKNQLKYVCGKCNYIADSKYKLERHFQSKKHQRNL